MRTPVALLLAASLLLPLAILPPGEATPPGSTTIVYTPSTSDAGAFFFRLRMNEETSCMTWRWNVTMRPTGEPLPFVFSAASSADGLRIAGQDVSTSINGRDVEGGATVDAQRTPQDGDEHLLVNVTVGGATIFHSYQEAGYDHPSDRSFVAFSSGVCDIDCQTVRFRRDAAACSVIPKAEAITPWLSLIGTARVSNATVKFDFWETYNRNTGQGTHGNARGEIVFASDSNRTFLKQLKDFDGVASYNGDPLHLGAGPNAAGFLVEKSISVERGMAGGFGVFNWNTPHVGALSFVGPDGHVGASSQSLPLSPPQMMTTFEGPAGEWTFRAHAYAAPAAYSSLYLWGADIATD